MISIGLVFWILMILWFVLGAYFRFGGIPGAAPQGFPWLFASDILLFILFLLLGIGVFGWPIRT
jgi:hypothetical protein